MVATLYVQRLREKWLESGNMWTPCPFCRKCVTPSTIAWKVHITKRKHLTYRRNVRVRHVCLRQVCFICQKQYLLQHIAWGIREVIATYACAPKFRWNVNNENSNHLVIVPPSQKVFAYSSDVWLSPCNWRGQLHNRTLVLLERRLYYSKSKR